MLGKSSRDAIVRTEENRAPSHAGGDASLVLRDMRVAGDCVTEGSLRILGTVTGNVSARGLELGSTGRVEGDVAAPEGAEGERPFLIDGSVEGAVRASVVQVGQSGSVNGGVVADEVVVRGRVRGGVVARRKLSLEETAVVEGDVHARRLGLQEGGQVNGTIRMGDRATLETPAEARPAEPKRAPESEGAPRRSREKAGAEVTG